MHLKSTSKTVICAYCGASISTPVWRPTKYCNQRCAGFGAAAKARRPAVEYFWKKVDTSGECWLWTASQDPGGYGHFSVKNEATGKHRHTAPHRFSWELHHGPIPDGLLVCHHCDVRLCVNPSHLFLGTNQENIQDASQKGRLPIGEANRRSKLTPDQVREIRRLYDTGKFGQRTIAKQFGVRQGTIQHILWGITWRHVK
jgi:hypothetical protein